MGHTPKQSSISPINVSNLNEESQENAERSGMNFESEKSSSKRSESDETDQNHHKKMESPLHESIMMNEESKERGSPV